MTNVLKLHQAPPTRAAIARLSMNYPDQLVRAVKNAGLADGTYSDAGHLMCRPMSPREQRAAALNIAGQVFASFFYHRARMEHDTDNPAPALTEFFHDIARRLNKRLVADLGQGSSTVADTEAVAPLHAFHTALVQHIFGAWRLEMMDPNPDEPAFWARVFLGLSDVPDPSGVVAEAARLVFLDHRPAFEFALSLDMAAAAAVN